MGRIEGDGFEITPARPADLDEVIRAYTEGDGAAMHAHRSFVLACFHELRGLRRELRDAWQEIRELRRRNDATSQEPVGAETDRDGFR